MHLFTKFKRFLGGLSFIKKLLLMILSAFVIIASIWPSSTLQKTKTALSIGKQTIKGLSSKVEEDDKIYLKIDSAAISKLEKYRSKRPVKKKWVDVEIKLNGEYHPAKLKFHGTDEPHYQNNKFSYSVKINRESPYIGNIRRFKLIKGEEAKNILQPNHLAVSKGLIAASGKYITLNINDKEVGFYYFVEDIRKELLERKFGITNYSIIAQTNDWTRKEGRTHTSSLDFFTGHIEDDNSLNFGLALQQYSKFVEAIRSDNRAQIMEYIDQKYMAKYLAVLYMFNDIHDVSGDNLKLIYDFSRGKFYPIYRAEEKGLLVKDPLVENSVINYNVGLFESRGIKYSVSQMNQLFKILVADAEIRRMRDVELFNFLQHKEELINNIDSLNNRNSAVHNHSFRYRSQAYGIFFVKNVLSSSLDYFKKYITCGHIYGTIDTINCTAKLMFDGYAPIRVVDKKSQKTVGVFPGIELDKNLAEKNIAFEIPVTSQNFNIRKNLLFINTITNDTIKKKRIYINYITKLKSKELAAKEHANEYSIPFNSKSNDSLRIAKGTYRIVKNTSISAKFISIEPGAIFLLDSSISMQFEGEMNILGSSEDSVLFTNLDSKNPFGSILIIGDGSSKTKISYLKVSGGSESNSGRIHSSGQFSIYNSDVTIQHSQFSNSRGDDGINLKYCKATIANSSFTNNYADQMDLDFCFATVQNCSFFPQQIDANGDGLDLSGCYVKINSCTFDNFLDKAMSIGERSTALIMGNTLKNNNAAIAIKDQSEIYCWPNTFKNNTIDHHSFIKKPFFDNPSIYIDSESKKKIKITIIKGAIKPFSEAEKKVVLRKFDDLFSQYSKAGTLSDIYFRE